MGWQTYVDQMLFHIMIGSSADAWSRQFHLSSVSTQRQRCCNSAVAALHPFVIRKNVLSLASAQYPCCLKRAEEQCPPHIAHELFIQSHFWLMCAAPHAIITLP